MLPEMIKLGTDFEVGQKRKPFHFVSLLEQIIWSSIPEKVSPQQLHICPRSQASWSVERESKCLDPKSQPLETAIINFLMGIQFSNSQQGQILFCTARLANMQRQWHRNDRLQK
jgi:hypothetical protein